MIQAMYPGLTKLKLFCRGKPRDGWDGRGNQCEGAIDLSPAAPSTKASVAANDPKVVDIGDEFMAPIGEPTEKTATARLKRAA